MSLKLSAGCQCCGPCDCSDYENTPEEIDVTLSGLYDGDDCDTCSYLNDSFTLTDPLVITDEGGRFTGDGWYDVTWATNINVYARAADVPTGTTKACVWKYQADTACSWSYSVGTGIPYDYVTQKMGYYGMLLARFKISSTEYIWRIIILYQLEIRCTVFGTTIDSVEDSWYWETTKTSNTCELTGSETWTPNFPSNSPLLSVTCGYTTNASLSDYCSGSLTLDSAETAS
tara:strand:+ start:186 stop:875 length:690 start_codon:yes stop_codon:yes gene_type:complete